MNGEARKVAKRSSAASSLREQLLSDGFRAAAEGSVVVSVGGRKVRLRPLVRSDEGLVLLCDPTRGAAMPPYVTRRRVVGRVLGKLPGSVVVFVDAAGTERVWGRRVPLLVGGDAYRERSQRADENAAAGAAAEPARAATAGSPLSPILHAGAEDAGWALLERLRTRRGIAAALDRAPGTPGGKLQELVEASRSPLVTRAVWRELQDLRILDPSCGDGEWLCGALEALVCVGVACLERMRAWVEDQRRSGERCRPEKLADFKHLLLLADGWDRPGGAGSLVRELVLLWCIRGVELDPLLAAECRRHLTAELSAGAGPQEEAELAIELASVREGTVEGGITSAGELAVFARGDPVLAARVGAICAEAAALGRAEAHLARMRLREGSSLPDLITGLRLLRSRRAALGHALSRLLPGRHVNTVHAWLEQHEGDRGRGFDLVRNDGAPRNPARGECGR